MLASLWSDLVPQGPLHPDHALIGLLFGLLAGAVSGHRRSAGPLLLMAAVVTLWLRQPELVPEGLVERPRPALDLLVVLGAALAASAAVARPALASPRTVVAVAVAGCAGVWAIAPDTEPALIGGAVLAGAWAMIRPSSPTMGLAVVVVVPCLAAGFGTIGRPERLPLALAAAVAAMGIMRLLAWGVAVGLARRQRAGTPRTVAPGATSDVTTAPAATVAP